MIQFYNVQFYNQGSTSYSTSNGLFNVSGGWAPGTSVNEIIAKGVPMNKIVVGKAATLADADSVSYMTATALNSAFIAAYNHNKWSAGVMFWQYSSDNNGAILSTAISGLMNAITSNKDKNLII